MLYLLLLLLLQLSITAITSPLTSMKLLASLFATSVLSLAVFAQPIEDAILPRLNACGDSVNRIEIARFNASV